MLSPGFKNDNGVYFTVDDILEAIGVRSSQKWLLGLGGLAFMAYCAELFVPILCSKSIMLSWPDVTPEKFAWVGFWSGLTSLIGTQFWGSISDTIGRQIVFSVSLFISSVFNCLCAAAPNFTVLIILRCFATFGVSGVAALDYLYIMELLPPSRRNSLPTIITISGTVGLLYISSVAWICFDGFDMGWEWVVFIGAIPLVICSILRAYISVETPYFLFDKGDFQGCWTVLEKLCDGQSLSEVLGTEVDEFCLVGQKLKSDYGSSSELLKRHFKRLNWSQRVATVFARKRRGCVILVGGVWFLHSLGYWGLSSFLPIYWDMVGFDPHLTFFLCVAAQIPGLLLFGWFTGGIVKSSSSLEEIPSTAKNLRDAFVVLRFFALGEVFNLGLVAILLATGRFPWLLYFCCLLICFFAVPLWNGLKVSTPMLFPVSVRATAFATMQQLAAIPPLFAFFVGAKAMIWSELRLWIYPAVWCAVYGLVLVLVCSVIATFDKNRRRSISQ